MTERKMEENKMPRTYKYWTEVEDALLRELRNQGYRSDQIADHMGRTTSSITNRTAILGLPVRTYLRTPNPVIRFGPRAWARMDKLMAVLTGRAR